jgi:hypothetical protein
VNTLSLRVLFVPVGSAAAISTHCVHPQLLPMYRSTPLAQVVFVRPEFPVFGDWKWLPAQITSLAVAVVVLSLPMLALCVPKAESVIFALKSAVAPATFTYLTCSAIETAGAGGLIDALTLVTAVLVLVAIIMMMRTAWTQLGGRSVIVYEAADATKPARSERKALARTLYGLTHRCLRGHWSLYDGPRGDYCYLLFMQYRPQRHAAVFWWGAFMMVSVLVSYAEEASCTPVIVTRVMLSVCSVFAIAFFRPLMRRHDCVAAVVFQGFGAVSAIIAFSRFPSEHGDVLYRYSADEIHAIYLYHLVFSTLLCAYSVVSLPLFLLEMLYVRPAELRGRAREQERNNIQLQLLVPTGNGLMMAGAGHHPLLNASTHGEGLLNVDPTPAEEVLTDLELALLDADDWNRI